MIQHDISMRGAEDGQHVDLGLGAVVYITYTDVGPIGLWNIHTEFDFKLQC